MIVTQMLLALSLLHVQADVQPGSLFPPKPQDPVVSADFSSWHGWTYLQGAPSIWPKVYETSGDWTEVQDHFLALKPDKPAVWRLKVVIFTRLQSDGRDASGVLREHRATIESVQLAKVRIALLRFNAYVAAKYDAAVTINPDIQVEGEWMRDSGPAAFGPEFAQRYFEPRINGGNYEAEDKIFRGPFNSVIYILPGALPVPPVSTVVNDTPVSAVTASPVGSDGITSSLDKALRNAWLWQISFRAKQQGYLQVLFASPKGNAADQWSSLTSLEEVPAQTYLSRLKSGLELHQSLSDPAEFNVPLLPSTDAKIVPDSERGQVLKFTETSGFREGGLSLPARADGMAIAKLDATPTFSFYAKSVSKDPVSIKVTSTSGKTIWVSLGQDPPLVTPMQGAVIVNTPFSTDGKWQKVSVDLKSVGMTDVLRLAIEPSPNAKLAGKNQPEPIEVEFADFKFTADAANPALHPTLPSATSEDPEARALFAAQAKQPSAELALLLKDKNPLVRLNATSAYIGFKDTTVEEALIANSLDLDPSIAAAALTALQAEGSDTARAVVKRSVSVSLSDYAKMTAAKLVADTKDPKVAEDVSRLLANRSWQAHVLAVESLAQIATPESQTFRMAFIGMSDPAVKLAVTRNADVSLDRVASALLWSAVNEPSDRVRAESYIKLIQSSVATNKSEGYKGVRDDSKFVRKLVLEFLTAHPSEEHRNALRTAVADRAADVRAASLSAFATLEQAVTLDEISNVLDDLDPRVQIALINLSKKKGVKLPQKTIDSMLSSPDGEVVAAAKALGNGTNGLKGNEARNPLNERLP